MLRIPGSKLRETMISDKLAVDIVLLPPDDIQNNILQINKAHILSGNKDIILDLKKCIPHITLVMGIVTSDDLPSLMQILPNALKYWEKTELVTLSSYKERAWLKIKEGSSIEKLHDDLMNQTVKLLKNDPIKEMFYGYPSQDIDPRTIDYVRKFRKDHSFSKYEPHITIGHGCAKKVFPELSFVPEKLVLCHLGNFCTCCKILWEQAL